MEDKFKQYFSQKNLFFSFLLFLLIIFLLLTNQIVKVKNKEYIFIKYINNCKKLKKFIHKGKKIKNSPFLSICIPVFNMERYIKRAILSVLNQSFKDFEIIIINDFSNDKTDNIIKELQKNEPQIRIINHNNNLGTFSSRVNGILNSNGIYIIFLDSDDLFLESQIFQKLYDFNLNKNLDMIEFTVYYEDEENNILYFPNNHESNHYHNYSKNIIYQPELSNLLFRDPQNHNYSHVFCRSIWNKMVKKEIYLKTINFIQNYFNKNLYFVFAEDTIMNILNFQFSSNYSNVNIPGYMYYRRKNSISHGNININLINNNSLLYLKLFYNYIKYFNKNINYLYYEIKFFQNYLWTFKGFNFTNFKLKGKSLFNIILGDKNITKNLNNLINNYSL